LLDSLLQETCKMDRLLDTVIDGVVDSLLLIEEYVAPSTQAEGANANEGKGTAEINGPINWETQVKGLVNIVKSKVSEYMPDQNQVDVVLEMLKVQGTEKFDELLITLMTMLETGDMQGAEEAMKHVLEMGLCAATVLGPNLILAMFFIKAAVFNAAASMADKGMVPKEEAMSRALIISAKLWQNYGRIYHKQEWHGLENIPDTGGALLVYYHGVIPLDYFALLSEVYLKKGRVINSIVHRVLTQIPVLDVLQEPLKLRAASRETCSQLLRSGELVSAAPGGAYEGYFGGTDYQVLWGERVGFAEVALAANCPIIPIFTENIREATLSIPDRMGFSKKWFEWMYSSMKSVPFFPVYGVFPVKLDTHIGQPIFPRPGMTSRELADQTIQAMQAMISEHQTLPGSLYQAMSHHLPNQPLYKEVMSRASNSMAMLQQLVLDPDTKVEINVIKREKSEEQEQEEEQEEKEEDEEAMKHQQNLSHEDTGERKVKPEVVRDIQEGETDIDLIKSKLEEEDRTSLSEVLIAG